MKPIATVLLEKKLITKTQLDLAMEKSKSDGIKLEQALIQLGFADESELLQTLAAQFGLTTIDLTNRAIEPTLLPYVPYDIAVKYSIVPITMKNSVLYIATSDPMSLAVTQELENRMGIKIILKMATSYKQIDEAIERLYRGSERMTSGLRLLKRDLAPTISEADLQADDNVSGSSENPVIQFVNQMITKAARERASDIHVEKDLNGSIVRYRIDGILRKMFTLETAVHTLVISRIKIMANLDTSEHRLPQDGRFFFSSGYRQLDLRVTVSPCIDGENIVIRILQSHDDIPELRDLGYSPEGLKKTEKLLANNHGLILLAGQTGSGKTTSLYSMLRQKNSEQIKIITLEDPVEIRMPLLNQMQVDSKINFTFASGLRSILRMDPDIILVGEIRDTETAKLTMNAAMTGHLVFSTIHSGIAAEAPTRLAELGVEPYMIAGILLGTVAQRLIRLNCPHCMKQETPDQHLKDHYGIDFPTYAGEGCNMCSGIGYKGRTCFEEVMILDKAIRDDIMNWADSRTIQQTALKSGMISLEQTGLEKVKNKQTSLKEFLRVI